MADKPLNHTAIARALKPFGFNVSGDVLETILANQEIEWSAKWARYAAQMRSFGFDPDKGDLLLIPSNLVVCHAPDWVRISHLVEVMTMMRNPNR
jgi:hypothetical protein